MVVVALMECVFVIVVVYTRLGSGLIARIRAALLLVVVGVLAVHVARLETLVLTYGWTLLVVAHIDMASVAIATLDVLASTIMTVITLRAVQPVGLVIVRKMKQLASIMVFELWLISCFASAKALLS
jgi:hypothetical protein